MKRIGQKVPLSGTANSVEEALQVAAQIGRYPLIIRPAFTCGGAGGGIAYNVDEFKRIVQEGIDASMTDQVRALGPDPKCPAPHPLLVPSGARRDLPHWMEGV